jgi:putative 4-mercaptohistidine N1-methyltranferase
MSDLYESDKILAEYLLFHFGTAEEILPPDRQWPPGMSEALNFPVRTVAHFSAGTAARGLDLGCAVGRSAFEMSSSCQQVIGIDYSHAFIRTAEALRMGERVTYHRREEAGLHTPLEAKISTSVNSDGIQFRQGDAMNLPAELGAFDRVHAANLLCRLPHPIRLLERLPDLLAAGGELVLATPCTWLEEFTPIANWPGKGTLEWLTEILEKDFSLIRTTDEPFLIRETARKFQWTSSLVTVWRRNG